MSLSLDTVLQVVALVRKAVEVYRRIEDGPEQMVKIGRRMERLETLLASLEHHLRTSSDKALLTADLLVIIQDTRDDCEKVYKLFDKWKNNVGPLGTQWRFPNVGQAFFTLGTSAEKLEALANDIEAHRRDIDQYMNLMGLQGIQANQDGIEKLLLKIESIDKMIKEGPPPPSPPVIAVAAPSGNDAGKKTQAPKQEKKVVKKPSPSPGPSPPKNDYQIIFVDPYNTGRSVMAEFLTRLMREWTIRTGGDWRALHLYSAGFFLNKYCDCVDVIEKLKVSHHSYRLEMLDGGRPANPTAVAAVFDNNHYNYPFKATVRERLDKRISVGLKADVFKKFDYILVFTGREYDNMLALRKALLARDGAGAAPKGKGRILHLGRFLTPDGTTREIVDAPKNKDGTDSRANWNVKVAQMKTAIKGFLKQEMQWRQPDPKAVVKS